MPMHHQHLPILDLPDTPRWAETWDLIQQSWVPDDPYQPEPGTERYYRVKHAVAQYVQPGSICEIGVRAGYSALAFLAFGSAAHYVGIDMDMGTDGGVAGYSQYARLNLGKLPVIAHFYDFNSQLMSSLPRLPHDLMHVDGDHSYEGCYHDVCLALDAKIPYILVDDVDMMPDVSRATLAAAYDRGIRQAYYVPDGGYRGNILLCNNVP